MTGFSRPLSHLRFNRRRRQTGCDDFRVAATPTSRQGPSRLKEAAASGASAPSESLGKVDDGTNSDAGGNRGQVGALAIGRGGGRAGGRGSDRGVLRGGVRAGMGGGGRSRHVGAAAAVVGADDVAVEMAPS